MFTVAALSAAPIAIDESEELALVLLVPSGAMNLISRAELEPAIAELVRARSSYRLKSHEGAAIAGCGVRLGCLAGTLFGEGAPEAPRFLLVVSAQAGEGIDRLRAVLIDIRGVAAIRARSPEASAETFEDRVFDGAVLAQPPAIELRSKDELEHAIRKLLFEGMGARLFDLRASFPGTIEVEAAVDGMSIAIDGRAIGATRSGITEIAGAHPGVRRLSFEDPKLEPFEALVDVPSLGRARVHVELRPHLDPEVAKMRGVAFWGGAAAGAAGGIMLAVAGIKAAGAEQGAVCVVRDGAPRSCPSDGYVTFADGAPGKLTEAPSRGVPIAPIGFGLVTAGAVWAISTWLGDQSEMPWLELVIGAAAGAGALAVSFALE